jgi:parvulin-like peptidyl-prolyl isomerase
MHNKIKSKKSKAKSSGKKLKFLLLTCTFSFFLFPFSFCCFAQDKIVAIVNNEAITQKDLDDFLNFTRMQLSKEYNDEEAQKMIREMKKDLLEKLIEDRLILQEAQKSNIRIDENRIKGKIADIRRRYPSDAEFQDDLLRQGLVQADLEKRIREQLLTHIIVEQKVHDKIMVNPDEVTYFYNNNLREFISPEERDLDIFVLDVDREDLAREFVSNFKSGQKLEDLATKYPLTVDKLKSKRQGELRNDIEDTVSKLIVGEVSEPIKVNDKYYVFKLNNITASRQLSLPEVQDKIQAYLFEKKMQEQMDQWLDELKEKSYIKIVQDG